LFLTSSEDGFTTLFVKTRTLALWSHAHIGKPGGQMQSLDSVRMNVLTTRSSRE
jgi:hypothetical protein